MITTSPGCAQNSVYLAEISLEVGPVVERLDRGYRIEGFVGEGKSGDGAVTNVTWPESIAAAFVWRATATLAFE
jgi:hypothetical protein